MTRQTLELLQRMLHRQTLAVGEADFAEIAPQVVAAKGELQAALDALPPDGAKDADQQAA
jgi:hypothetical protein